MPSNAAVDEEHSSSQTPPYSIFNKPELTIIGILLSFGTVWSTLSSSLYYPAIPRVSEDFHITAEVTNLSLVAYLVFQSFTPVIISGLADRSGRRPVSVFLLLSYCGICVGISQVHVFWLLAVLRCLQATSIASIISVSMGAVGDLARREHRGGFVGYVMGASLSAQAFGGIIGGALVLRWDWEGLFVFCAIGSGAALLLDIFLLPETNRKLVGNQSIRPKSVFHFLPILALPRFTSRLTNDTSTIQHTEDVTIFGTMLDTLKIFFSGAIFFTMLPAGIQFATWTMSMTALSTILREKYSYSDLEIGLAFFAPGIGGVTGSVMFGRLMDWNFKRHKKIYEEKYTSVEGPEFDIHAVRSQFCTRVTLAFAASMLIFGWCIDKKTNVAPVLVFSFLSSMAVTSFVAVIQTLLVDLYPSQASALSSCFNLMRCLLAAAGVAAVQSMINGVGAGGSFTIMVGLCGIAFGVFKFMLSRKKA